METFPFSYDYDYDYGVMFIRVNRPIKLQERPFEREHLHVFFSGNLEIAEKADMAV